MKICKMCGRKFEPKTPNQKYCDLVCRYKADRERRKAWEDQNPEYNKLYARQRREKDHK